MKWVPYDEGRTYRDKVELYLMIAIGSAVHVEDNEFEDDS